MPPRRPAPPRPFQRPDDSRPEPRLPYAPEVLRQQPLCPRDEADIPDMEVRAPTYHPFLFRRRLGQYPQHCRPGDVVRLKSASGEQLGYGLFNPRAEIAVRQLSGGFEIPDEAWWRRKLESAVDLRRKLLQLDEVTNAYRVVHAEGDGLSGLVVDRFNDVLVVEAFALGMYQRAEALLDLLGPLCGTTHGVLRPGPATEEHEGFTADPVGSDDLPSRTTVQEFGTRFRVDFTGGHKTGFYCDQRDNRREFAKLVAGKSVLDVCCYTGGFAIQAKVLGNAAEVTGVEVDEQAAQLARDNANLNQARIHFAQSDAFAYLRDMQRNGKQYDALVLDPPKLIRSRDEEREGRNKYFDLNRLAMSVIKPGGILLTCSCSGMLDMAEFTRIVSSAPEGGRRGQIFNRTGASGDHPIATNCPESEYLKTIWMRME
ncbi:class I SAM-dependent rRNA methyltransferase [Planctellipticum variicoloris]|uniref:class I SAM-dependent rRNA methyltransferase n=1 Tax=Planctellipticum variicoloris TaxID=3064265 RepID=UPI003013C0CE|nr:class I SAM-dependent rRNA methyltransferase [Planctomycetaceae bacterium SH412]